MGFFCFKDEKSIWEEAVKVGRWSHPLGLESHPSLGILVLKQFIGVTAAAFLKETMGRFKDSVQCDGAGTHSTDLRLAATPGLQTIVLSREWEHRKHKWEGGFWPILNEIWPKDLFLSALKHLLP